MKKNTNLISRLGLTAMVLELLLNTGCTIAPTYKNINSSSQAAHHTVQEFGNMYDQISNSKLFDKDHPTRKYKTPEEAREALITYGYEQRIKDGVETWYYRGKDIAEIAIIISVGANNIHHGGHHAIKKNGLGLGETSGENGYVVISHLHQ